MQLLSGDGIVLFLNDRGHQLLTFGCGTLNLFLALCCGYQADLFCQQLPSLDTGTGH